MLVMFTGRPPFVEGDGQDQLVTKWASDCLSSGDSGSLKHPTMDAPPDVVLHVAQLALTCTAERTAARPSMAHIANELQSIREEVVGKVELIAAVKVEVLDDVLEERKDEAHPNPFHKDPANAPEHPATEDDEDEGDEARLSGEEDVVEVVDKEGDVGGQDEEEDETDAEVGGADD
ncbi:unnamed protein product [Closterium sp. Naga37s-1]|nr:unnamed protein product [Closterium sp. Naga37s-1]